MKAFAKLSESGADIALIDAPSPTIDSHELLVSVQAIGVGVHDEYFLSADVNYPYIIGIEAAGMLEEVGSEVRGHKKGDRIAFVSAMQPKGGTWAEYAVVSDSSLIVPIPDDMSFQQAAAIPVPGNTALKAFHTANLKKGDSVFIAGGSGAIGTLAIQIAVSRGYRVAASASSNNHAYMKELGAEKVVDYHDSDWQQQIREWQPDGVDVTIAVQPGTASESEDVVKNSGIIVAVSGDQYEPSRDISLHQIPYASDVTGDVNILFAQIASHEVQLPIEHAYPFTDGLVALEKVKTRHTRGKIVLIDPQT